MRTTLTLAERAVPRYTSYPTAPHFSPDVEADTYAAWLAALPTQATLSLYLHVPYCSELCLYCGCTTKAVRQAAPVAAYADLLRAEIDRLAAAIGGRRIVRLHWGGGTPRSSAETSSSTWSTDWAAPSISSASMSTRSSSIRAG
jgi:oxygen-independent coproporphyrinogen III oxidase